MSAWRKEKGYSQEELGKKLGLSQATYQSYESGRTSIPDEIQAKIKKMGFDGPWPQKAGQEGLPAGVTPEQHARDVGRLDGRLDEQGKELGRLRRRLEEAFVLIQDLGRRAGIKVPPLDSAE